MWPEAKRPILESSFGKLESSRLKKKNIFPSLCLIQTWKTEIYSGTLHNVIRQIYNYKSSLQLQYGILSSYDYHWFMYRPKNNHTELHISHPLRLESTSPPVLKAYAYLAQLAERDPTSPSHNVINHGRRQNSPLRQVLQSSENTQIPKSMSSSHYCHLCFLTAGKHGRHHVIKRKLWNRILMF